MSPFSRDYRPVIQPQDLKTKKAPTQTNVYDTGTAQERMERHAKPLPIERNPAPKRPSTM